MPNRSLRRGGRGGFEGEVRGVLCLIDPSQNNKKTCQNLQETWPSEMTSGLLGELTDLRGLGACSTSCFSPLFPTSLARFAAAVPHCLQDADLSLEHGSIHQTRWEGVTWGNCAHKHTHTHTHTLTGRWKSESRSTTLALYSSTRPHAFSMWGDSAPWAECWSHDSTWMCDAVKS